ncbi:hypothetical protein FB45DRAFT_675999, partial [Roridomyces roridus]
YSLDVKESIRLASVDLRKPAFPDSLWRDVLLDRFVDLDAVIAGQFAVEPDEAQHVVIGEHQLEIKKPKVVSRITNHGDWIIAWRLYERAVNFAFRGRNLELETYANHMHDLFASWHHSFHYRVLNYDRAARNVIGQNHGILFSDIYRLRACENAHLSAGGTHVVPATSTPPNGSNSGSKGKQNKRTEVCRNYNFSSCDREVCRFQHVCHRCKSKTHTVKQC